MRMPGGTSRRQGYPAGEGDAEVEVAEDSVYLRGQGICCMHAMR